MEISFVLCILAVLLMFFASVGGLILAYLYKSHNYIIKHHNLWWPSFRTPVLYVDSEGGGGGASGLMSGNGGEGVTRRPFVLFGFRLFAFVYNLLIQLVFLSSQGFFVFYFFTIWNYTLLIVYFAMGTYFSGKECYYFLKNGGTWKKSTKHVGIGGRIFVIFFQIVSTLVLVVDIILWTVLYPYMANTGQDISLVLNFFSYNQHGINLVFVLIEFFLNQLPFFPIHVLAVLLWPSLYTIFIWIAYEYTHFYPYFFMDTSQWSAPIWYVGVGLVHVVFFYIMFGLHVLKKRCLGVNDDVLEVEEECELDKENRPLSGKD